MKRLFYIDRQDDLFYPGMFNLLKGLLMLSIIYAHTKNYISIPSYDIQIPVLSAIVFFFSFFEVQMPVFWILSSYGFKTTKMNKCIKKQSSQLLIPYVIVMIMTICVHFICYYCIFHNLRGDVVSTIKLTGGYLLGTFDGLTIKGVGFYGIGPVWFILSLWEAWLLLNFLTLHFKDRTVGIISLILFMIGQFCYAHHIVTPFCLTKVLEAIGYLYVGYMIRKYDLFKKFHSIKDLFIVLALFFASNVLLVLTRFRFFYIVCTILLSYSIIVLFMHLNQIIFPFREQICLLGRYSLWVMCIHTIENQGILWYSISDLIPLNWKAKVLIVYVIKCCIILASLNVVIKINSYINKKKKKKTRRYRTA